MIPLRFNTEKLMRMIQQLKIPYIITGKVIFPSVRMQKNCFLILTVNANPNIRNRFNPFLLTLNDSPSFIWLKLHISITLQTYKWTRRIKVSRKSLKQIFNLAGQNFNFWNVCFKKKKYVNKSVIILFTNLKTRFVFISQVDLSYKSQQYIQIVHHIRVYIYIKYI